MEEMEEAIRILEQRRVDGVLMVGSVFQNDTVENGIKEHFANIPVVFANGRFGLPNVYCVLADNKRQYPYIVSCFFSLF